ncbi:transketolase [Candidatus Micrarchaeota archaeon CG10_big_fil_rev_8_21_14_0_10_45_29]|nr:MAG: transketolase [Candidatus Micrarchaeota archaeon CG10_big_fil_rev_8_21_14_0_10_45_29]
MDRTSVNPLSSHAKEIRRKILKMIHASKSAHIASALSTVELLVSLYFKIMRIDPKNPSMQGRDILIFSKGHGCSALYATLVQRGYENEKILQEFSTDGGKLWGHVTSGSMKGIEATAGSLGHGLPIGLGMALANKKRNVFVLMGDGECDEGSVWEAILFAGHARASNLIAIIDFNKIQSLGNTAEVLDIEPLAEKFRAAKWAAKEVDGHSIPHICAALQKLPFEEGKPSVLIAHTTKGKGISFMENSLAWHYTPPDDKQLEGALGELS